MNQLRTEASLKVLILSFYYPPDLSAGSFRASGFVSALRRQLGDTVQIEVLTSTPNRYQTFQQSALAHESVDNVTITRILVPRHKSGMVGQAITFARFAWGAWRKTGGQNYSVIWATSSRLFTAFLGALLSRRLRAPLYLDIRDIFTDVIQNILTNPLFRPLWWLLRRVERFTFASASRISLVSKAFEDHILEITGNKPYLFLPNGIDEEFIGRDFSKPEQTDSRIILYAGNIGEGQGLHRIIPHAARRLGDEFEFWLVGDGGAKAKLENALARENVRSVRIIDPVGRSRLVDLYALCDYLFLHLNDHDAFRRVLPSKVFEYGATGKPIIAGVEGYARAFIEENLENAAVFKPCDVQGFVDAIHSLKPGSTLRTDFVTKFRRSDLMNKMVSDLSRCCERAHAQVVTN